jgi:hypothetical protein
MIFPELELSDNTIAKKWTDVGIIVLLEKLLVPVISVLITNRMVDIDQLLSNGEG